MNVIIDAFNEIIRARQRLVEAGVIRTESDVTGQVAEYLAAKIYNLKLVKNSVNAAFDALDSEGKRYQIKSRKVIKIGDNTSFDFHSDKDFDYFVYMLFDKKLWKPLCYNKIPFNFVKANWAKNKRRYSLRWPAVKEYESQNPAHSYTTTIS